jgi:hypothetical protein
MRTIRFRRLSILSTPFGSIRTPLPKAVDDFDLHLFEFLDDPSHGFAAPAVGAESRRDLILRLQPFHVAR